MSNCLGQSRCCSCRRMTSKRYSCLLRGNRRLRCTECNACYPCRNSIKALFACNSSSHCPRYKTEGRICCIAVWCTRCIGHGGYCKMCNSDPIDSSKAGTLYIAATRRDCRIEICQNKHCIYLQTRNNRLGIWCSQQKCIRNSPSR